MSFLRSWEHLEQLCNDIMDEHTGVAAYIDDMKAIDRGSSLVEGWDEDLRKLKHYRWVRNQLATEAEPGEAPLWEPADIQWMEQFRKRLAKHEDPLALYYRAQKPRLNRRIGKDAAGEETAEGAESAESLGAVEAGAVGESISSEATCVESGEKDSATQAASQRKAAGKTPRTKSQPSASKSKSKKAALKEAGEPVDLAADAATDDGPSEIESGKVVKFFGLAIILVALCLAVPYLLNLV